MLTITAISIIAGAQPVISYHSRAIKKILQGRILWKAQIPNNWREEVMGVILTAQYLLGHRDQIY